MHLFFIEKDIGIIFKLPVRKGKSTLFIPHFVDSDQFEKHGAENESRLEMTE